jgi:hypothetical protein
MDGIRASWELALRLSQLLLRFTPVYSGLVWQMESSPPKGRFVNKVCLAIVFGGLCSFVMVC